MKNIDLLMLGEQLKSKIEELKLLQGAKFTYGLSKNISIIEEEIKHIQESIKPTEEFTAYDEARVALCKVHAKKDKDGEFIYKVHPESGQQEYDIDVDGKKWTTAIEKLRKDNSEAITKREKQLKDYNELLDADCEIEFYSMSIDSIPNEINVEQMLIVQHFIKD